LRLKSSHFEATSFIPDLAVNNSSSHCRVRSVSSGINRTSSTICVHLLSARSFIRITSPSKTWRNPNSTIPQLVEQIYPSIETEEIRSSYFNAGRTAHKGASSIAAPVLVPNSIVQQIDRGTTNVCEPDRCISLIPLIATSYPEKLQEAKGAECHRLEIYPAHRKFPPPTPPLPRSPPTEER
jgi:hypothetical protein